MNTWYAVENVDVEHKIGMVVILQVTVLAAVAAASERNVMENRFSFWDRNLLKPEYFQLAIRNVECDLVLLNPRSKCVKIEDKERKLHLPIEIMQ